jgi:hypothetical protein
MQRLTGIEKATVALGLVMVMMGIVMIVRPQQMAMVHRGTDAPGGTYPGHQPEIITPRGAQFYGAVAVLMGAGICLVALTGRDKR